MQKKLIKFIPFLIMASFLTTGCAQTGTTVPQLIPQHGTSGGSRSIPPKAPLVYVGNVSDVSKKAKVIAISVGKGAAAKTILVKFDDKTKGVEHASVGHASIINYEMRAGEPWATVVKPKLAQLPAGVTEIKTAELKALVDKGEKFTLIDSRPAKRASQGTLPGAIIIPSDVFKDQANKLPSNKDELLVFFCGGPTWGMSPESAGQARKMGYKNAKVYLEGEPAWSKAGYPLYATNDFISKGNIVLIDLRSVEKSEAGRIPRSVTIPGATLSNKSEEIPLKAPVVLYSDNTDEALKAMNALKEEGFKKVSLVPGNIEGWIKAGGETTSGPVVSSINWIRQMEKGEVSAADFMSVAEGKATDAVILDVRGLDETATGMFKNSISIPLDQIGKRKGELPKDKKIYLNCSTGARAAMAAADLNKDGYKAFYLGENVSCKNNVCAIEE